MAQVKIVCGETDRYGKWYALVFSTGIAGVRNRVITYDIRDIVALTDMRRSEVEAIQVGEEVIICK